MRRFISGCVVRHISFSSNYQPDRSIRWVVWSLRRRGIIVTSLNVLFYSSKPKGLFILVWYIYVYRDLYLSLSLFRSIVRDTRTFYSGWKGRAIASKSNGVTRFDVILKWSYVNLIFQLANDFSSNYLVIYFFIILHIILDLLLWIISQVVSLMYYFIFEIRLLFSNYFTNKGDKLVEMISASEKQGINLFQNKFQHACLYRYMCVCVCVCVCVHMSY